ncbi:MAG: ABC transporter ATP-binding protein [Gammaproteobacteria bacterium]|nr:ABC transporter ATP-binding protein [Gammaproteobacteria bacterium]
MKVIELNNIKKSFAELKVLNGIDLHLEKGEVLGLFGHNGAGKTTTMKMILGLLKPTSGEIKVFGQTPFLSEFNHHRYQLGFLPENVSFYQQLSGMEVLRFFAKLKKVSKNRCIELIKQVGLWDAHQRKVKTYSKGMKQRLGLAQALLTQPSLLLLDEPTVGLDPIATQEFYNIIDTLRSQGCSIILCSHILAGLEAHIDKAAILSRGYLKAFGSVNELREKTPLETSLIFKGCFDMEEIGKKLGRKVEQSSDGQFTLKLPTEEKLQAMKILMAQQGLQDLNVNDAGLEQIYRYYIEKDHQLLQFPTTIQEQTADKSEVLS